MELHEFCPANYSYYYEKIQFEEQPLSSLESFLNISLENFDQTYLIVALPLVLLFVWCLIFLIKIPQMCLCIQDKNHSSIIIKCSANNHIDARKTNRSSVHEKSKTRKQFTELYLSHSCPNIAFK